jgi:signal peptidase II
MLLMLGCVGCDQVTKAVARAHLVQAHSLSLLGDTLRLQHEENAGAFLSIGASLPEGLRRALFTAGGALLTLGAMGWALFSPRLKWSGVIGAALISSGGVGNLIDRFTQGGHVTDFLNVGIGGLRTGIFNVADMVLVLGLLLAAHDGMTARD